MTQLVRIAGVLLFIGCGEAAACAIPNLPAIGEEEDETVTSQVIARGQTLLYLAGMSQYVECIQAEHSEAAEKETPEVLMSALAQRNNSAVVEVETVARFYEAHIGPISELQREIPPSCIGPKQRIRSEVIGREMMLFYPEPGVAYLSVFAECPIEFVQDTPALRDTLEGSAQTFQSQFCNNGLVDVRHDICMLGPFYSVSEVEAQAIRTESRD